MMKFSMSNLNFKAYFEIKDSIPYYNYSLEKIDIINLSILQILVIGPSYQYNHNPINIY
jgi:hypothetical protein